jgi:hypothetical protein
MKNVRGIFGIAAITLFYFLSLITVHAQSATANLSGAVRDERGASIAGATVTITDPATNLQRQVVTKASGEFFITELPPSRYTLRVEMSGFTRARTDNDKQRFQKSR